MSSALCCVVTPLSAWILSLESSSCQLRLCLWCSGVGLSILGFCDVRLWVGVESMHYLPLLAGCCPSAAPGGWRWPAQPFLHVHSVTTPRTGRYPQRINPHQAPVHLPHLRLREHCKRGDGKSVRARGSGSLIPVRLCLLGMLEATPMSPHQHGCQTWDVHMSH